MAEEQSTQLYVVRESGTLSQAGVALKAGQDIALTAEQYADPRIQKLVYPLEEGEQVKAQMKAAKEARRQERLEAAQQGESTDHASDHS